MTTAVTIPKSGGNGERSAVAAAARSVTKAYGSGETRVLALDAVDVDIARGRFTAIMGPSGSGKSTLMHCLAGLDTVTEGRIWVGDTEITTLKDKKLTKLRRDKIGFIFQSFNLLPTLNAAENITLPMDIAGRKVDRDWFQRVVETVGLSGRLRHRPNQLSGGQQQRVAVARALAARPEIIFGDEPTGNLDSRAGAEVLGFLRRSVDELGQTIVMVTHDPVAASYADRALYLADGRIVDDMDNPTADSVLERMKSFDGRGEDLVTVFKTSVRNFFAHKGRMALSAVAVLLSVAFICGTLVFTDTMTATFDKLFGSTASDVTISAQEVKDEQQTGIPDTVPASLQSTLTHVQGVAESDPDVTSTDVTVVDAGNDKLSPSSGAPTVVSNWDPTETKAVELTSGQLPKGPSDAALDADTAKKHHLKVGDTLRIIAAPGDFKVTVTGIVTFKSTNPGAAVVYVDTATAQSRLLGRTDAYTGFGLTAAKGVTDDQLKASVKATIGSGYTIDTAAETKKKDQDDLGGFLDFMKYAMLGFAGIAVLVGIFLIVNTFSMLVAQRTREIGLMRALGSSRGQVNRSVLIEAIMLGVVGSVLGIGGGIGLAIGLMKLMGKAGMNLDTSELTIKAATPIIGLVIGVVVTVLSAYIPARRAGKISPMAALRDAGTPADGRAGRIRTAIGILVVAGGALALVGAGQAGKASTGGSLLGLGVLLSLVGFVIVGPLLAGVVVRAVSAVLLRFFGPMGRLAERNALRNPRRTGATASALMIGLALVAGMSVVGSSMVASANDQLDKSVGADFIMQVGSDGSQPITPAAEKALRSAKDLAHLTEYTIVNATITTPSGKAVKKELSAADATYAQDVRLDTAQGKLADAYGKDAMSVPEGFAKDNGIKLGDRLSVAMVGGATAELKVAAITSDDTSLEHGSLFINIATARTYLPADKMPGDFMMFGAAVDGKQKEAYASLKAAVKDYPQIDVRDQADYKDLIQNQVNQLLYMIYGLLGLAIVVAVLGVINTLALSVVERTREIGLMRAIGTSRRQLRRMIRLESVVIALFGALVGLGLGLGWGSTAQRVLASQGLGILRIPWTTIVVVFIGSAVVGLLAALLPAFRAARMNVLNAIATD